MPIGPLAFSEGVYHLRTALESTHSEATTRLLKSLGGKGRHPGANHTACFWGTPDASGVPDLRKLASLCHAWASDPTGELSAHELRVAAVAPGYRGRRVDPVILNLE
jgi:hypothetical protein